MDENYVRNKQVHSMALAQANAMLEVAIAEAAKKLVEEFTERRHPMQLHAQEEERQRAGHASVRAKHVWCPLNLATRYRNGHFELEWKEIHKQKGLRKYTYIRRSEDGDYDQRDLKRRALAFETDLVAEFEEKARLIRADWKRVIQIRTALRYLSKNKQVADPKTP